MNDDLELTVADLHVAEKEARDQVIKAKKEKDHWDMEKRFQKLAKKKEKRVFVNDDDLPVDLTRVRRISDIQ